jgi:hypothetical protein
MIELKTREEYFPSSSRMKQLKAFWIKKIINFKYIMHTCNEIVNKKEMLFRKLADIELVGNTGEVQESILIMNSIFMKKQQFEEHVDILKIISAENFNSKLNMMKERWKIG